MKKLFSRFTPDGQAQRRDSPFFTVGFHGDRYLLELAGLLLRDAHLFVETGANVGSTLAYVAGAYPHVRCISCEPDLTAFVEAIRHTHHLSNVFLFNEASQQFMASLHSRFGALLEEPALFWLDAHGYGFQWPLRQELAFITESFASAWILIDDFKVPGLDMFGYDRHGDQVCSWEYVRSSLDRRRNYRLYYPAYTDRTSPHHNLRGWGLLCYGRSTSFEVPPALAGKIRQELSLQLEDVQAPSGSPQEP